MTTLAGERGETLIEILITIVVMAIGMVAVMTALTTSVVASDVHRQLASGEVVARGYGEAIKTKAAQRSPALSCPGLDDVRPSPADYAPPTGWNTPVIDAVHYWIPDPANFPQGSWTESRDACETYRDETCGDVLVAACDPGLQRVTFTATNERTDRSAAAVTSSVLIRRNNAQ